MRSTTPLQDHQVDVMEGNSSVSSTGVQEGTLPHLQLFWAHRRLLLRVAAYAALVSTIICFLIPAKYQSVTRIMPPDDQSGSGLGLLAALAGRSGMGSGSSSGSSAGSLIGLAGDALGLKSSGDLFIGILGSDTAEDQLIDEFKLKKVYHDSKIEDAREDLEKYTDISEDRKSGIISIKVTDHYPSRSAAMAQAYVTELDYLVAQVSTSSARRERIFLEERLRQVQNELGSAEKNFADFASENTAIDITEQGKAMVDAAAILQGQLIAAQAELNGLREIYTDNNVRVRSAKANVDELQKKLDEIGGAGTQAQLQSDNSLYPSIRKLPLLGETYADLYRQTKIQETVYELLTQQYELAKVQEAKEIPTVKVLDKALVPTKRSFPPRVAIIVLGTILGIALAMTWVSGRTHWATVDDSDPRKIFAIEVFNTLRAGVHGLSRNGSRAADNGHRAESRETRHE